jgi:steroid 5-alpha reductase family enzyme
MVGVQSVFKRSMPSDLIRGWRPIRVKKTCQIENLEPRFDSIETEKALARIFGICMTFLFLEALAAIAVSGLVCDAGLWRWSRHPNYFFEWFGWLAYPLIGPSTDYPWGWATLSAPVFMYWILVHVTGIPPLEQQMLRSRGARYRDYQSRTSMFFPRPPQKGGVVA